MRPPRSHPRSSLRDRSANELTVAGGVVASPSEDGGFPFGASAKRVAAMSGANERSWQRKWSCDDRIEVVTSEGTAAHATTVQPAVEKEAKS